MILILSVKGCNMSKRSICLKLFFTMLRISAFTFGGGFVIIPLIRTQIVEKLRWMSEEDMLDMVAIAQSSPGAVALNVAAQVGCQMAGKSGVLCAVSGTLIPPIVWICLISLCYDAFRTSPVVDAFLRSMQPTVAAVILWASFSMLRSLKNKDRISTWLLFSGAIALSLLGVKAVYILLIGAVLGMLIAYQEVKRHAA